MARYKLMFSLCLLAFNCFASQDPYGLQKITVNPAGKNQINIIMQLTGPAKYKHFFLNNPRRLVIDLVDTRQQATAPNKTPDPIQKIRTGTPKPHWARIVIELRKPVTVHKITRDANKLTFQLQYSTYAPRAKKPPRDVVILIDPGHGGKDPGASGSKGTKEKTVVLAIAKALYDFIDKEPGMKPVMTRNGNYYVTLRQRLNKARSNKADVFIAIHADAYKHSRARGASVYALSTKGASSEAARWLAEKENYSELGGINLDGKGDVLRSVLIDLSQTATISSSLQLGDQVLKQLNAVAILHHQHVEQAPFVVLKSPDIPSILIETGFISNPSEEMKLRDQKYQRALAKSILNGLHNYFKHNAPPGTHLATKYNQQGTTA